MNQTPQKKSLKPSLDYENTEVGRSSYSTNIKKPIYNDGEFSTPKKISQYVPTKDRVIRKTCFKYIRVNRGRMVDWFFQIFSVYKLGWESYWICVELLDTLIGDYDYVSLSNIHIVGIACVFISSKYANVCPIKLYEVVDGIAHHRFNRFDVLREEEKILELIFKHAYIQRHTVYHYLIEEYQHANHELLCEVLRWIALVWVKIDTVLPMLGVATYKELVHKIMFKVSQRDGTRELEAIVAQNEAEWGVNAWKRYSHKINL